MEHERSTESLSRKTRTASTARAAEREAAADSCCVRKRREPWEEQEKRRMVNRLSRIEGQIKGIKAMVEEDRYCGDVLVQLAAVEKAVAAISREVMQDHLRTCVVERVQAGDVEAVDEVMDLLKRFG